MQSNWQVVLGGEGGQGSVLAGVILGEAAVLEDRHVAQTAAYGIASRGGFAKSEVVISDEIIEYPSVEVPNLVLALSQGAMDKYYGKVTTECILIYDSSTISGDYSRENVVGLPLTEVIEAYKKQSGGNMPLNILSLGALVGLTDLVSLDSLTEVVIGRFKKGAAINREALQAGYELGLAQRVSLSS
jgi:2-oxoglutarate ferredoxin oxidoreductase subunit gamma